MNLSRAAFLLIFVCAIILPVISKGQVDSTLNFKRDSCEHTETFLRQELGFMQYLVINEEFDNALEIKSRLNLNCQRFPALIDSINYYSGWSAYRVKDLSLSSDIFKRVTPRSPFYSKSRFYASFCQAYSRNNEAAIATLLESDKNKSTDQNASLMRFQLAGNYLLTRNYEAFDSIVGLIDTNSYFFAQEAKQLRTYEKQLLGVKKKSPFLAGAMSAIIPGSGKFYAGYRGQAIAAAIPCFLLGAVAIENYIKAGPRSPQFIAFASIFSIYYIGNIWGSVISVRTYRDEIYNKIDHGILVDMHIPLRRFFD